MMLINAEMCFLNHNFVRAYLQQNALLMAHVFQTRTCCAGKLSFPNFESKHTTHMTNFMRAHNIHYSIKCTLLFC